MTRLLDGRHQLERFAMEQAGEVDYLITWRDEFVARVSLTPCRPAGVNRRCFASPLVRNTQIGELGAKVGMGLQPVMRRCTAGHEGYPHVDDVVGEVAAVRESF